MITFIQAKEYLDKGWSVIPVTLTLDEKGKVTKKPAIAWREYQERRPTQKELHTWFDKEQYNAIGLITGKISNLVVVDVDELNNNSFHSPMVTNTISGGKHYYYAWTEEIRNDAALEDKPVDFRGDGGFVVLPPSSLNTQSYTWEREVDPMFLQPLPEEILFLLKIRKGVNAPAIQQQGEMTKSTDDFPFVTEGSRNNIAAQVAGMLISGINQKLWDTVGWKAFKWWNTTHVKPSLDEKELRITWESIKSSEKRNHIEEESPILLTVGKESLAVHNKIQSEYGTGLETGFSKLDTFFSFLPDQLYLLSAPTHQGKTTLALNMAARLATFGEPVLFASLEQGVFIAPRVETILGGEYPDTLSILTSYKSLTVHDLIMFIKQMTNKPKIIFIDHLHFIKKEGKGVTEDIDEMMINLQNMAKELHLPVFVIAHVRKLNGDRAPELDDLRDSSSLSQVPSVVMLMYRPKNDQVTMDSQNSYLSKDGALFIAKNRIQGKTGVVKFRMEDTGEVIFS